MSDPSPAPIAQVVCGSWLDLGDPADLPYLCGCDTGTVDPVHVWAASSLLYMASGRQFPGLCPDTIRPSWVAEAFQFLAYGRGGARPITQALGADWVPYGSGTAPVGQGQGAGTHGAVHLPQGPVHAVTEVLIDGSPLPASDYRLVNHMDLMLVAGSWPSGNDLSLADTEPGTWSVSYTYGTRPDPAGLLAVGALACHTALACADSDECRLPRRLQQVIREGVTNVVMDPFEFLDEGRFGLYEVDSWLSQINPAGIQRRARVLSHRSLGSHDRS